VAMAHPTTRRLQASTTTARYKESVQVEMCVMSATQSSLGLATAKSRSTRSDAGRTPTCTDGSPLVPTTAFALQSSRLHIVPVFCRDQPSHPLSPHPHALIGQLSMDARRAIGASRANVFPPDPIRQDGISSSVLGAGALAPHTVPADGDAHLRRGTSWRSFIQLDWIGYPA
jgi:hypothetical protein